MSALKKIWVEHEEGCQPTVMSNEHQGTGTQYIRADLVEDMRVSLSVASDVFRVYQAHHEYKGDEKKAERNKFYAEQMEAALKALEEE
jgi:hypothetical protein